MQTTLLKNVTLNDEQTDILLENNLIKKISKNISLTEPPTTTLDCTNKVIIPPFYNTHTHSPMSLLKGLGSDKRLYEWLKEEMWPREAKMTPEDIYIGSKFAVLEMIKSGTVFFNDMYMFPEETMKVIDEMGIRGCVCQSKMDFKDKSKTEEVENLIKNFVEKKENFKHNRIIKSVSCHAVYTCSEELLKFCANLAKKNNSFIHIHASETLKEVEDCKKQNNNLTPIEYLEKCNLLTDKTILAHCVHLTNNDIQILKKHNVKIAHCPISNFKLNSGQFQFDKVLSSGIKVTLGTDGSASNNSLSMFEEMKVCALNAKSVANSPTAGKVDDIFNVATKNGPEIFGLNGGEIKEGKLADFILVDLNHYHLIPNHDFISDLVYSADNSVVTDLFCDGKHIMKNGVVQGEKDIIERFKKVAKKFRYVEN